MGVILNILAFLLILGVLVFVHELGHFAVAKWMGMRVDEFAIGFPPRVWSKKKGETRYMLNAIPFGGYVRIHGESPESQDGDPRGFESKSVWARIAVVIAGVVMNLLFAFVILVVAFSVGFSSISQDLTKVPGATVSQSEVIVSALQSGGGADTAGIKPGDSVVRAGDQEVTSASQLATLAKDTQTKGGGAFPVQVIRDDKTLDFTVQVANEGPALGVYLESYATVKVPFWRAPGVAVKEIWGIVGLTWDALKGFGGKLVQHAELDENVSGPVGIYQATGAATQAGVLPTVFLVVALSINLALLNILPIPALDGGKLVFLLVEAVARKRIVNRRLESAVTFAGFVLVMGLILILSVRDVVRLF